MRHVAVILLWLATSAVAQEKPELDAGRAVAEAVARILATPRFEEQVEVRDTYQESLARYFVAAELSCGATDSGPPQPEEQRSFVARAPWRRHLLGSAEVREMSAGTMGGGPCVG